MTIKLNADDLSSYPFVQYIKNTLLLSVYIQPNAKETAVVGLYEDKLKIKIAALPVDGKANKFLCDFIAKQFSVPKKNVTILKGESSRHKLLKIDLIR